MIKTIVVFSIASLINVILQTAKQIITVKTDRPINASIISAITYGFYTIIIQYTANMPLAASAIITAVANLFGTYFSIWLLEKIKKEALWKISITAKSADIVEKLKPFSIDCLVQEVLLNNKRMYLIEAFSKSKKDSNIIRNILNNYEVLYNISEVPKRL